MVSIIQAFDGNSYMYINNLTGMQHLMDNISRIINQSYSEVIGTTAIITPT